MQKCALPLTLVATASGHRAWTSCEQWRGRKPFQALASLFLACDPFLAFHPALIKPSSPDVNPKNSGAHAGWIPHEALHHGHQSAAMQLVPEDDPARPQSFDVPEPGTVLRRLRVAKVQSNGVYCEVNPKSGLHGFIYHSGLDNGYVERVEDTFRVNDTLDVKVLHVSTISGRLMLSRKMLMEEEGSEKHALPEDGRRHPTYYSDPKTLDAIWPFSGAQDPSILTSGACCPRPGSVLRGLKVAKVVTDGCFLELDPRAGLQGFMFKSCIDTGHITDLEATLRKGDVLDAKVVGISGISNRLLLNRAVLMNEEGRELHHLPEDGRTMPRYPDNEQPSVLSS